MRFYLGTHKAQWLGRTAVPLFISHRTLHARKTLPRALGPWALDSGGFTEISLKGHWGPDDQAYADAVLRYQAEIGQFAFASTRDLFINPVVTLLHFRKMILMSNFEAT